MFNKEKLLSQSNLDRLDSIAEEFSCELLLPPVNGDQNVAIYLGNSLLVNLAHLAYVLLVDRFSFIYKKINGKEYLEITGVHNIHD